MDQINALLAHWVEEPPAECLIAAFLGYKAPSRGAAADATMSPEDSAAKAAAIMALAYAAHDRKLPALATSAI